MIPAGGIQEWDRPGGDIHDAEGLAVMMDEMRTVLAPAHPHTEIAGHINDEAFSDAVLKVFDDWVASGVVKR